MDSQLTGDRRTYQMDAANRREAIREVELDLAEGADMIMVKPAMSYLDVLADVAAMSPVPVAAYQISGEYAMIEAAAANGWIDRRAASWSRSWASAAPGPTWCSPTGPRNSPAG